MHKVIVERPRWNPGQGKNGRRANFPDELLPKFEGIKRPYRYHKGQRDLLGPLRRWLQSQVGRPWNDVYSEACDVIKPDNYVRVHVKTHLLQYVERNTFMHEGKVCVVAWHRENGVMPVEENRCRYTSFYIHPETGLLCEISASPRRRWRDSYAEQPVTGRWIEKGVALHQIRGIWYKCYFEVVPVGLKFNEYDIVKERVVSRGELTWDQSHTHCLRCTVKHQLSRRELRQYGLRNDVIAQSKGAQTSADNSKSVEICTSISFSI